MLSEILTHSPPDDFTIYNGDDIMILCGLVQGAAGVVSGAAHFVSPLIRKMIDFFMAGENKKACEIHHKLDPLFKNFCQNNRINGIPIMRYAVCETVMDIGDARGPLDSPTNEEKKVILDIIKSLGI